MTSVQGNSRARWDRPWLRDNYVLVYFTITGALVLLGWWLWS